MAINFPNNPTLGQIYSFGEKIYKWNGKKWITGPIENNSLISSEFTDYKRYELTDNDIPKISVNTNLYNFVEYDIGKKYNLWDFPEDLSGNSWLIFPLNILYGTLSLNQVEAIDGNTTADLITEDSTASVTRYFQKNGGPYEAGKKYTHSVYVKRSSGNRHFGMVLNNVIYGNYIGVAFNLDTEVAHISVSGDYSAGVENVGNDWYRCWITASAVSNGTYYGTQFRIIENATTGNDVYSAYNGDGSSGLYVWGAVLEEGELGDYYRPGYKNKLIYTQEFENNVWFKANTTITKDTILAPDNTLTGDLILETNTTGNPYSIIYNHKVDDINQDYTLSFYVKKQQRRYGTVRFTTNTYSSTINAEFDLDTGTVNTFTGGVDSVGNAVISDSAITEESNGWYRVSITGKTGFIGRHYAIILMRNDAQQIIYDGDSTKGMYVWGAQLEKGTLTDYQRVIVNPEYTVDITSVIGTDNFLLKLNNNGEVNYSINWPTQILWANGFAPDVDTNSSQIIEFYKFDGILIADTIYNG